MGCFCILTWKTASSAAGKFASQTKISFHIHGFLCYSSTASGLAPLGLRQNIVMLIMRRLRRYVPAMPTLLVRAMTYRSPVPETIARDFQGWWEVKVNRASQVQRRHTASMGFTLMAGSASSYIILIGVICSSYILAERNTVSNDIQNLDAHFLTWPLSS
jgi:hypothetical protein